MSVHVILAHCSIEVQAYGANNNRTTKYGFVNLNTVPVWQAAWLGTPYTNARGVNVMLVDPFKCSLHESRKFDTYRDANAANELNNYLQQISSYYIVVGVTADAVTRLATALPTLAAMGADVADVQYRGAFAFVAQKGFAAKTVLSKALTQSQSYVSQPHVSAIVTGAISCRNCQSFAMYKCSHLT